MPSFQRLPDPQRLTLAGKYMKRHILICTAILALAAGIHLSSGKTESARRRLEKPIDTVEKEQVVSQLARDLQNNYFDAVIGAAYASMLHANMAKGAYNQISDPEIFGERLTEDLKMIATDSHLRVGLKNGFERARRLPIDAPKSTRPAGPPGLEDARMMGRVAYLRFNSFPDNPDSAIAARAFLLRHADADAVIIDVRPNRGGGLSVMNAVLPLFYSKATVQVRMDTRASAEKLDPSESDSTLVRRTSPPDLVRYDHVIQPDQACTQLEQVPVYYLISRRTASAAEHMALALKRNHRAVLVGESTAGANHFGNVFPLADRFLALIPIGRTYDPDTGQDWEGTGITPDHAVPADAALSVALALAKSAPHRGDRSIHCR